MVQIFAKQLLLGSSKFSMKQLFYQLRRGRKETLPLMQYPGQ
jgi:hypothetical protein